MPVKNNLREIRMREYLEDPKEFAKRLDIALKTYYQYEDGTSKPNLEKALDIGAKLNKKIEEIWYKE